MATVPHQVYRESKKIVCFIYKRRNCFSFDDIFQLIMYLVYTKIINSISFQVWETKIPAFTSGAVPVRRGDRAPAGPQIRRRSHARVRNEAEPVEAGRLLAKQMRAAGGSYTCCESSVVEQLRGRPSPKCQRGEATRRRVRPVALASLQRPSANLYLTTIRLVAQPWIVMQRRELVAEGKLKLLGNK